MTVKLLLLLSGLITAHALYADTSTIINLNADNFDTLVKNGKEIWLVEFFAPWCGHSQSFASDFQKAANALEGIVKVGAINADENADLLREFDISEYPTVKLFNAHNDQPEEYLGERTAAAIVNAVLITIHSKVNNRLDGKLEPSIFRSQEVVELTDVNFDDLVLASEDAWLVVFYSPFCEQCRMLSPQWTETVAELKGTMKCGALDGTVHFAKATECKIDGFPTMQFFPPAAKTAKSGISYAGNPKANEITAWALEQVSEHAPVPKVQQVVGFDSLKEACDEKSLCVISILPHILECQANCRNAYLDMLQNVSETYKKSRWGWVWSEAGAQPEMEAVLEIGGFGYPALAAVNVKKMKYSLFVGSFSVGGISEFLRDVSYGRGNSRAVKLMEVPEIKVVEPWDGLDGEIPPDGDFSDSKGTKDEL